MKKINLTTTTCIAFLALSLSAFSASAAQVNRVDKPEVPNNTPPEAQSIDRKASVDTPEQESSVQTRYRVCFYAKPGFKRRVMCRTAPSQVGVLKPRISDRINSVKIVKITGFDRSQEYGSHIKLKLCNGEAGQGNCEVLNKSQSDLSQSFDGKIRSYAFEVKS